MEREVQPSPFDRHYGLELDEATDELVRGHVPVVEHVLQPVGLVHGGVHASIAEALASVGTNVGVMPEGEIGLGMSNNSTFLRSIREGTIHATARRIHRGRTTWVWDVDLRDDDGRLCAVSRVTKPCASALQPLYSAVLSGTDAPPGSHSRTRWKRSIEGCFASSGDAIREPNPSSRRARGSGTFTRSWAFLGPASRARASKPSTPPRWSS